MGAAASLFRTGKKWPGVEMTTNENAECGGSKLDWYFSFANLTFYGLRGASGATFSIPYRGRGAGTLGTICKALN